MQNSDTPLTPPAEDQTTYTQVVPEMSQYVDVLALQKVLQMFPNLLTYNQTAALALSLNGINPLQVYQAQLQLVQQQFLQVLKSL